MDKLPYHPGAGDIANLIYFRPESTDLTLLGNGNEEELIDDPDVYAPRPSPAFNRAVEKSSPPGERTRATTRPAYFP